MKYHCHQKKRVKEVTSYLYVASPSPVVDEEGRMKNSNRKLQPVIDGEGRIERVNEVDEFMVEGGEVVVGLKMKTIEGNQGSVEWVLGSPPSIFQRLKDERDSDRRKKGTRSTCFGFGVWGSVELY
ncbi:hypothetical protein RJT34_13141 [Clitoria ternatea]|uniref:Uncharacterized protein n=1 Tax=Clitoria ternatea TaxID=43366 RepID=A0AAN9PL63_CLITE